MVGIMYEYKVKEIVKIYDGDTITVMIDLGFNVTKLEIIRLALIDTPEIRGDEREEGLISRDWLRERLYTAMEKGIDIYIRTNKDHKGKYGRYIGEIFIDDISINKQLVTEGLAIYKQY